MGTHGGAPLAIAPRVPTFGKRDAPFGSRRAAGRNAA
jgi:hypothetical protein